MLAQIGQARSGWGGVGSRLDQHQKHAEQTKNRMRARSMNGDWVFRAPIGYRFERVAGHGKLLVRNEPLASIVADALTGYASGRLETLRRGGFLESQAAWPKDARGEVHPERVAEIVSRRVYAGHIALPEWGLNLIPAKHEPLVSLATWQAVLDRRNGTAKAPTRKDIAAYEKRIRDLETEKVLMREKIASCGKPLASFGETYRTAFDFLANSCRLWHSPRLEDRRAVLKLVVAERLPCVQNEGYRTAKISMSFKLLGSMETDEKLMVPRKGLGVFASPYNQISNLRTLLPGYVHHQCEATILLRPRRVHVSVA